MSPSNGNGWMMRGFTLLEVLLGVVVVALVTLSIARFLEVNLMAMRVSTEVGAQRLSGETLMEVLKVELQGLSRSRPGAILGEAHLLGERPTDEIEWITVPGNGMFTRHAAGEYRVKLELRTDKETRGNFILGITRRELEAPQDSKGSWLELLRDVQGMEIRYFDPRLNAWLEKWTDQNARPTLVRIRLWRGTATEPEESVLAMPPISAPIGGPPGGAIQQRRPVPAGTPRVIR